MLGSKGPGAKLVGKDYEMAPVFEAVNEVRKKVVCFSSSGIRRRNVVVVVNATFPRPTLRLIMILFGNVC